jgi:hypothetical protein
MREAPEVVSAARKTAVVHRKTMCAVEDAASAKNSSSVKAVAPCAEVSSTADKALTTMIAAGMTTATAMSHRLSCRGYRDHCTESGYH